MARFENLGFNSGEYIPQYAGIPLQQIQQTADTLANRHYQNLAQASQLQILQNQLKSQALPGAKAYFDTHINAADQALQEMARNGGENSTARINALATAFQSDQGMLNAMQRAKEFNKQTELIDELTARGEQPLYDKARREALMNASPTDEVYNTPYSSAVEGYIDPHKEREDIWRTINPDSYEGDIRAAMQTAPANMIGESFAGENPNLPMFFEAVTRGGISGKKIKDMLDNAWQTYKNTKSYKQQSGKLIGKDDDSIKQEFYQQGLLRVFQNVSKEYRPTPNYGRQQEAQTVQGVRTPMSSRAREGFEMENIDPLATLDKDISKAQAAKMRADAFGMMNKAARDLHETRAAQLEALSNEPDSTVLARRVDWMKTAMMDAGIPVKGMSDDQIAKFSNTDQGKKVLGDFTGKATGNRYHAPIVDNIIDETQRNQVENFVKATVQDRQFIDLDTNKKIGGLKDEHGETKDELKEVTKAIRDGKFVVQGTTDPKHILTDIGGGEESDSFTRAIRASVYLEDGTVKDVLVGQLPATTQDIDINENVLYRQATDVEGRWAKLSNNMEIMQPSSQKMQEAMYEEYFAEGPPETRIPKEQFMSPGVIFLREKGKILPAANYTVAAEYLTQKGTRLKRKK